MSDPPEDVGSELWYLIADEPEAQKMFLTWPRAHDQWMKLPGATDGDVELDEIWAELSGIGDTQRIRYFKTLLFGNELLHTDGTQSSRVLDILKLQVAADIRRLGGRRG